MKITFLVGNGFDISCGINSSYRSFYNWYCKQRESDKEHINSFRSAIDGCIKEGKKDWADFEIGMGKYTENFTPKTVQQFIDCYIDAHEKLMEYLELETKRFSTVLSPEGITKLRLGLNEFYSELRPSEVELFTSAFSGDITSDSTIQFLSFNYTDILDRCISQAAKEPLRVWRDPANRQHSFSIIPSVIHVHGKVSRFPVFGVDNENQIANKELLSVPDFTKLMIKPKNVEEMGEFWHRDSERCIDNSNIICVFGMSLGETDSIWFEKIMEWLEADGSRQLILYWQTNTPSNNTNPWLAMNNRRQARKRITDYSDLTNESIEAINNRIHIIENTNKVLRIKLKEAITEES